MKKACSQAGRVLGLALAFLIESKADPPPIMAEGIGISTVSEKTTLVRTTGKLSSTVDLKLKNTGAFPIEAPLHAVVEFTDTNGGNLNGLTMTNMQGGIGVPPYQTFYRDLSTTIGAGLVPGAGTAFSITFERPPATVVSYKVVVRGVTNHEPAVSAGGPYSGQVGQPVRFNAAGSSDPDGDALTFEWDFGDGTTATGAEAEHAFDGTGLHTVRVTVSDPRGGSAYREIEVPVIPAGEFALARTRTLDGNGHPLGEVGILQTGPGGSVQFRSDAVSGFASLGGQAGDHVWTFSKDGFLTTFRKASLEQGRVKVVAFPWLAPLNPQRATLSVLNPTLVNSPSGKATVAVPPGAFPQIESVSMTDLHGQSLPLPLPFGWSPLAAFHLDLPGEAAEDLAVSLQLLQSVPTGTNAVLIRCDIGALAWKTESVIPGNNSDLIAATLRKPGSYAVVIADTLPSGNPVAATVGETLPAGTAPVVATDVTAIGTVNPAAGVASLDPEKVTAAATVDFTNGTQPLPSGVWFLADVEETYDLRDGQALKTPDYDATFYAYQSSGDVSSSTATATFPLRPRILFGPDQLTEAHIKVDVRALNAFSGAIITAEGGVLSIPGVQLTVPAGATSTPSAAEIRGIPASGLSRFLDGFQALLVFDLNLPPLADGHPLGIKLGGKFTPNAHFVLAKCVGNGSESGLQPVLRLASDPQGSVTVAEPASGPRLPGITRSGQYVLVAIAEPEALITGVVMRSGGSTLPGAVVRVVGEPWLSLCGSVGTFATLAKPGDRTVTGSDPATGDSGEATAALADAGTVANVEIQTAPTGPRVVATTPAANDTKASIVAPITVEFSEPILPGSFGATGIRLHDVAANADVPGSLSLDLSNRKASLLPVNPLGHATNYEITVSNTIQDRQSLPIEGALTFPFKTAASTERPPGAQLTIFEPDAINLPAGLIIPGYNPAENLSRVVAVGSAGTADPEVPVILVNETTGETATVLSKSDGSFASFINAAEEDFISAVFVNANGTRIEVPATQQKFDDGRVGLYRQGGILEAESDGGPVQVLIEPQTIEERMKFRVDNLQLGQLLQVLQGSLPTDAQLLGGVRVAHEAEKEVSEAADISFPLDRASLQLPPGGDEGGGRDFRSHQRDGA